MKCSIYFQKKNPVHFWFKDGVIFDTLFADGSIKRFDMSVEFDKYPFFKNLNDRKLFTKAKTYTLGIVWNDDVDIASEYIYENGEDVTKEYVDYEQYLVGYLLKAKRLSKRITQEQLAKKTGINQATIAKIENGSMNPSVKTIMRIVRALKGKVELKIK